MESKQPDEKLVEEIKKELEIIFGAGIACQYDYSLNKLPLEGIQQRKDSHVISRPALVLEIIFLAK